MMRFDFDREHYGKLILIGTAILIWLLIIVLLRTLGYHETWGLWKVPSWLPPFLDFRLIPGSAESFVHGYEPSVENPFDPTERIFNYPAFWRLFFYTGITQADTLWISVSMIVLFFISVFLFPEKLPVPGAIGTLLVLFSPASMLLYERGNVDLIVFVVCVMIVLASGYSAYLAAILIMFGGIMKLFPILGLSVLLRESKKKFLWLAAASTFVVTAYMIATWDSVQASWNLTMRGDGISYGTDVFVDRYADAITQMFSQWLTSHRIDLLLGYGPLALALLALLVVVILAFRNTQQPETLTERNFAAFRMGASIYIGTFLLGNNWDYRLAFLVLVVPQLMEWIRTSNKTYRRTAWLSMVLVLLSCWHFWIVEIPLISIFNSVDDSRKFWIILDEVFNWMLFASLAYMLLASTPQWLKELPGSLLNRGSRSQHGHEQTSLPIP
jgi:hypothetical protein